MWNQAEVCSLPKVYDLSNQQRARSVQTQMYTCAHGHHSQHRNKCTHTKSPQSVLTQMYTHTHSHHSQCTHTHTQHRVITVSADTDINTHRAITVSADTDVQIHTVITVGAQTHTYTITTVSADTNVHIQSDTFSFPSDLYQPASFASFKTNPTNHVFVPKKVCFHK